MEDNTTAIDSLPDPANLEKVDSVPVETVTRTVDTEQFEALRDYYADISGVVQVGITTTDDELLLQGSETDGQWAPPGGHVKPDEDWVEAAQRRMETQTGTGISIDGIELLEHLAFELESDPGTSFTSYGVSFRASLADPASSFREDPAIVEHPQLSETHDQTFSWFSSVPEDANENHVDHIELFIE